MRRVALSLPLVLSFMGCWNVEEDPPMPDESAPLLEPADCRTVDAWIDAHRDHLPDTYPSFTALPLDYRRRVYGHLTDEVKAALWRAQLEAASTRTDALSEAQAAFLRRSAASMTPEFFRTRSDLTRMTAEMSRLFTREQHQALFRVLGPPDRATGRSASPSAPSCYCNIRGGILFGDCPRRMICTAPNEFFECDPVPSGCGDWWLEACDGRCCDRHGAACA